MPKLTTEERETIMDEVVDEYCEWGAVPAEGDAGVSLVHLETERPGAHSAGRAPTPVAHEPVEASDGALVGHLVASFEAYAWKPSLNGRIDFGHRNLTFLCSGGRPRQRPATSIQKTDVQINKSVGMGI
jgi:hypothetical protein